MKFILVFSLINFFVLINLNNVQSARILAAVPSVSMSHHLFFRPLWKALTDRGHEVVLITTHPENDSSNRNLREIDLSVTYKDWYYKLSTSVEISKTSNIFEMYEKIIQRYLGGAKYFMEHPEVQELIHNPDEKFDLFMLELLNPIFLGFKHRFNCPLIGIYSVDLDDNSHKNLGNPVHSVLYPSMMYPFGNKLNFFERVTIFVMGNFFDMYGWYLWKPIIDKNLLEYFGNDYPTFEELLASVDLNLVNNHMVFSPMRPTTPATVSISGGFHRKPSKPLPQDLQVFLDEAHEGAIYFSLGSAVKSEELSMDLREVIMKTFEQLPYKVLWKFEDDNLPGKPENVMIHKWLPQQDVLRHENVKLFISQGGIHSLDETLFTRKPVIVIPFTGDQHSNGKRIEIHGLGLTLDFKTLTVEKFKETILEMINNPKYKEAIGKKMDIIEDQPMKPLERAVWWTEYVLRHKGAQHLKGPQIPFYQYYYLDVIPFLLAVLATVLAIVYYVFKLIFRLVRCLISKNQNCKSNKNNSRPKKD